MFNLIGKLYQWFWHDFLCRTEPFTYQLRRQKSAWGIWWWIAAIGSVLTAAGFGTWLIIHVAG